MAVFTCPQCGHSQAVDDKHLGKSAYCPKCKTQGAVATAPVGASSHEAINHESHEVLVAKHPRQEFFANKAPSLTLDYVAINDKRHPLRFATACGVLPSFEGRRSVIDGAPSADVTGFIDWGYVAEAELAVKDSGILAFEMTFLLFDIWGSFTGMLQAYEVKERTPGTSLSQGYRWASRSRRDMECHLASIAYVSRVRCPDGTICLADTAFVIREARRYAEKFSDDDLAMKPISVT